FYGARARNDLFYLDEFEHLATRHPSFDWTVALSDPAPGDRWHGLTGFIHQVLRDALLKHPAPEDCEYDLCGPPVMISAVLATVDGLGVEAHSIFNDDFGSEDMRTRNPNRRLVVTKGLSALAMPALARTPASTQTVTGPAFGTQWRVVLRAGADPIRLREMIERLLARIDMQLSPWQAESTIGRFNRLQSTDWYRADEAVVTVAKAALAVRSASGGCFDPAVGPLVNQWGFGPITGELGADRGF